MNRWRFILRSVWHYRRNNLAIALGIAVTTAVITGALLVGDSITNSLEKAVDYRLGKVTHSLNGGDRFFTTDYANNIRETTGIPNAPVMQLASSAQTQGGKLAVPNVDLYGINNSFGRINDLDSLFYDLGSNEVIISENLAKRLDAAIGDFVLFHITKAGVVPSNTPFVSDEDQIISRRFKVRHIANDKNMGRFHLQNSQTAPFNAFVSFDRLNTLMELEGKANLLLFSVEDKNVEPTQEAIKDSWTAEDLNLTVSAFGNQWQIQSERVFIDQANAELIQDAFPNATPAITYFVNHFSLGDNRTPYSFVSTNSDLKQNETIINKWLALDLRAEIGDTITFEYFTVGPLRELFTDSAQFLVKEIITIDDPRCNPDLMPDIPGLSDAGSCKEWEAGVPVDLESIRDKDEEYWNEFRGTPKALIHPATAEKLWANRFGTYTSFITNEYPFINGKNISTNAPALLGITFIDVKSQGMFAAANGTDFGGLFLGLSFFIIISGLLLTILMFAFHLENRKRETTTLKALGFTGKKITSLILPEMIPVAMTGIIVGIFLGIGYNNLVFSALNNLWSDIVRTEVLVPTITASSLIIGALSSAAFSLGTIYLHLRRSGRKKNQEQRITGAKRKLWHRIEPVISILITLFVIVIVILQFVTENRINAALFFPAGGLLIAAFLGLTDSLLRRLSRQGNTILTNRRLVLANVSRNRSRSLMVIFLLMIGTFLVISTGANKKDMFTNAMNKTSGTGGFLYYGETSRPVLKHIDGNEDFDVPEGLSFIQLRVKEGDDASCLNLNKIRNPRIMAVGPDALSERFSFATFADKEHPADPWQLLKDDEEVIPAIADQTVIQWGLEKRVGDTLRYVNAYGDTVNVRLVAGLAASIFQGNLLMSEESFLKMYPYASGTSSFLIAGKEGITPNDTLRNDLERAFRDYGLALDGTGERLARFKSVENTYLSIFLALGALGLLLGTIGLAIILGKTILERKEETDTLKALGFTKKKTVAMLIREYGILLIAGVILGAIAAVIAVLPAFLSSNTDNSPGFIALILLAIIVNGFIWMWAVAKSLIRRKV